MSSALPGENRGGEHGPGEGVSEQSIQGAGDLWLAVVLIVLSIGVIVISLRMPRPSGWLSAPGIFPLFSASILLGLGLGLFFWTIFKRGPRPTSKTTEPTSAIERRIFAKRMLVAVIGILIYVFLLIPTVHFTIATFIYLLGTLWYFWKGKAYKIVLISLITTLFLSEMFKRFFQVILP